MAATIELLPTAIRAALSSQSQSQGDSALLHGPAGCGKTRFARSLNSSSLAGIDVRWLDAQKIAAAASRRVGGAEAELAAQLDAAKRNAPCVFIIDELEALAPSDAMPGSVETRLALQLAEGIEELQASSSVFVLGICRSPELVHPALRRGGRLNRALAMRVPTPDERARLLQELAEQLLPPEGTPEGERLRQVVRTVGSDAHGLCGAQLSGVCQHAAMAAWRRMGSSSSGAQEAAMPEAEDWWAALEVARAAAMGALHLPSTPSSSTPSSSSTASSSAAHAALSIMPGGAALSASLLLPLRHPDKLSQLGVRPPRGLLLHGPSGCGKTSLARHVATAAKANFVEVNAAQLISPTVGASEAALSRLFASARAAAPCILFLDNLEALASIRGADTTSTGTMDRLLSLLLLEVDGALLSAAAAGEEGSSTDTAAHHPPLILLGATSDRSLLDPSLLRPGRLDVHIPVDAPDAAQREALLAHMLARTPLEWGGVEGEDDAARRDGLAKLAEQSEGYSLAQLSALCREAAMDALREDLGAATVGARHLERAAAVVA